MRSYPDLDIRFPAAKEEELVRQMQSRAKLPWKSASEGPVGRPVEPGSYYFHRAANRNAPACIVCIHRVSPGHLSANNIIPDTAKDLSIEVYERVLREFDEQVASPAVEACGGVSAQETSERRLEDYFSGSEIAALTRFLESPGYGSHPSDQCFWIDFILEVHRRDTRVHGDTLGRLIKGRFPEDGIPRLVHDYDFALAVLRRVGHRGAPS